MLEFSIGLSALQSAQRAMQVTGNNVSNANSPGYHRQTVKLAAQIPMQLGDQSIGRGVEVVEIQRAASDMLDTAITQQTTQNGYVDSLSSTLTQLQSGIPTDASSITAQLGSIFDGLQQASSQLGNSASRQSVVASAKSLAHQFNSIAGNMDQMRTGLDKAIGAAVDTVNPLLIQIADLNSQIASLVSQGNNPNDLIDARDQLVNTVAAQLPVKVQAGPQQQVTLLQSGVPIVLAGDAQQFECSLNKAGAMQVTLVKSPDQIVIDGGHLGALLDARNTVLPDYRQRLETLAHAVSQAFDAIQTTGVGVAGGFTQLIGQRSVLNTGSLLNAAGLTFPPQAGSLFVGMTNTATGTRTMVEVPIDPATQNLHDVANSIGSKIPDLQAFVNDQAGTLSLIASPGYKFDFTGGVDAAPTASFSAGTTVTAATGGAFTGATNDAYKFTFLSTGTVGVTAGLQAQVTDQSGNVLGNVDIGQGYSAGQPISVANGVTLTLTNGDVAAGDSLTSRVVGLPDSAGLLTSLGLNTFFSGDDARTMRVNDGLIADPDQLATSQTGQPGDTTNLQRFGAVQDMKLMAGGTQTMSTYFNQIVSDVGSQVSSLNQQSGTNLTLMTRLQDQQQSVSGVDINEEMVNLIKYQQMFQAASKYISAVNDVYQQLFQSL